MPVTWCLALVVCARYGGRAKALASAAVCVWCGVVYFNRLANGEIWLLLIYAKSVQDNIPAALLRELKQEIENAHN